MSDPIDKLTSLGDALEGAPMPVPASEIRARGDRIRHRRHAVIAGASALVVATVAVPVVAFTLDGDSTKEIPPSNPSGTDPVPGPISELSEANLLTSKDAIYPNGNSDWHESGTFEGDGQGAASPCQQTAFAGLGADSVFQRRFEFVVTDTGEVDTTLQFNEVAAEFHSAAAAQSAYDEIKAWHDDCLPSPAEYYNAGEFSPVPVGVDGSAERQLSTFGPVEEAIDPFGDEAYYLETGLVLTGDRIAMLTQLTHGQDYTWLEGTPVEQMLPVAADRLVLGNGSVEPTDDPTPRPGWPTAIPAEFPLDSGWPQDDGSSEFQLDRPSEDNQAMIPAGDLDACLFSPVDPGALDRLTTRLTYGSAGYVRELQLFPTDQQAGTYLAQLRALYQGCRTDDQNGSPPTFTTEVNDGSLGEESVLITRASDGIGRVVINVVRIGKGVVVDLASDEGTGDTVIDLATETRENLSDVVAAMTDLQGGGSSGNTGTDPDAPATTAIPTGFPLASYPGEPPTADSETTITGPERQLPAVGDLPICGVAPLPTKPADRLGYSVTGIEYGDLRELRTYRTAQVAVDELTSLRDRLADCDREPSEQDGWSNVWRTFDADTGYDSLTFGYTTEMDDSDAFAPSGQLTTAVRVGRAILIVAWYAEYSADSMADNVPNLLDTVALITPAMCVFTADGC